MALRFARHLAKTIKNPFPGLPALEAIIGRRIIDRIGSNESFPFKDHPLKGKPLHLHYVINEFDFIDFQGVLSDEFVDASRLYPDPYCRNLRTKLSTLNSVPVQNVLVGAGADSLIYLALRVGVNVGDYVVTTAGTYPTFKYFAEGVGAHIIEVPYRDVGIGLAVDLEAVSEAANRHSASLVYVANPDNPTGHVHSAESISSLRRSLPESTTLVVDEAYIDFSPSHALRVTSRSGGWQNTIQLRTLSKAYGLAGETHHRCSFHRI